MREIEIRVESENVKNRGRTYFQREEKQVEQFRLWCAPRSNGERVSVLFNLALDKSVGILSVTGGCSVASFYLLLPLPFSIRLSTPSSFPPNRVISSSHFFLPSLSWERNKRLLLTLWSSIIRKSIELRARSPSKTVLCIYFVVECMMIKLMEEKGRHFANRFNSNPKREKEERNLSWLLDKIEEEEGGVLFQADD